MQLNNKLAWVYFFIIVCLTFTVIPGWVPYVRKEWMLLVLGTLTAMILTAHYFLSKSALCLYLYFIILYLNKMSGDVVYSSLPNIVFEVLQYLVPSAICFYMFKNEDMVFARRIVVVVLVIVCIESLASFNINKISPNIIRELEALTRAEGNRRFAYDFFKMGLADYSFCHALPAMIPPLICWIKDKDTSRKWIIWGVLFLTCLLIYISASGTAIFLMTFMLMLGFFTSVSNKIRNRRTLIISLIIFFPFIFSQQMQIASVDALMSVSPQNSYMTKKLESIRFSIEYGESKGDVEARVVRYNESIDGFKENVLCGSNKKLGGHSAFLDRLGSLGLLGVAPLILFLIIQFRTTLRYIPDKYSIFYSEGMIAALLMFLLKAVSLVPILIITFIVLPFIFVSISNHELDE